MILVDLLGNVGVSGKSDGTAVGTFGTIGLLGGVVNDGESGELGTSTILGFGVTGKLGTGLVGVAGKSCLIGGESKCWIFGLLS